MNVAFSPGHFVCTNLKVTDLIHILFSAALLSILRRGTLRGFHWQAPPKSEAKLVRVTRGAIHDVIVDLRPKSPTYLQHIAVELTADSGRMLYIPKNFAHGLQTLADNTEVFYQMSEFFAPDCSRGARWNDPAFGVEWPLPNPVLNERDRTWEDFSAQSLPQEFGR